MCVCVCVTSTNVDAQILKSAYLCMYLRTCALKHLAYGYECVAMPGLSLHPNVILIKRAD